MVESPSLQKELDKARKTMAKAPRSVAQCQSSAGTFRAAVENRPEDALLRLQLADALNCIMRIKTNGNMLLISGTQDSKSNIKVWKEVGPEAWDNANRALAALPKNPQAASVYADAFQYMSSAHGILRQALTGGGREFLRNAQRMQEVGPDEEGGLGFIFEGCFYIAAPWPLRDLKRALRLMRRALAQKKCKRNYYYVGLANYHLENYEDALDYFAKSADAKPEFLSEFDFAAGLTQEAQRGIKLATNALRAGSSETD